MGSYNAICSITGLPIFEGENMVAVPLKHEGTTEIWTSYLKETYEVNGAPLKGVYADYGRICVSSYEVELNTHGLVKESVWEKLTKDTKADNDLLNEINYLLSMGFSDVCAQKLSLTSNLVGRWETLSESDFVAFLELQKVIHFMRCINKVWSMTGKGSQYVPYTEFATLCEMIQDELPELKEKEW